MSNERISTNLISARSSLTYLQYGISVLVILYFGRDLFVPLAFSTLISFILYPACSWMEKKGIGRMTAILIGVTVLMFILLSMLALFTKQVFDFVKEWPALQSKLTESFQLMRNFMTDAYAISQEQQARWISQAMDRIAGNFFNVAQTAISFSAVSMVMLILVPIYSILILYYRHLWIEVLSRFFPSEKRENITQMLSLTVKTYYSFIKGMGTVYLAVGLLNSIGLLLLGVPHAILFGLIASVLTFIPYVGIMVGALLPITMAWIAYDSIWYPVGVVAIFTFVQYLEANVIFPWAVSNRLNVNTLVVLIAIFVGGLLWGVAGMVLFVPFVGIFKLIADHNPKLRTLSIALGSQSHHELLKDSFNSL